MSNQSKRSRIPILILTILLAIVLIAGFFLLGILLTLKFVSGGENPFSFGKQPQSVTETDPGSGSESEIETKETKDPNGQPAESTSDSDPTSDLREPVASEKALNALTLVCNDGSVLTFEGNDFSWILDPKDPKDSYYSGSYELYCGEDAEILLLTRYKNFDVTKSELTSAFSTWSKEDLRVLVLSTKEARVEGKMTEEFSTVYYGFFNEKKDDRIVMINMNEAVALTFEKQ